MQNIDETISIVGFQKPRAGFTPILLIFCIVLMNFSCQESDLAAYNVELPEQIDFNRDVRPILSDKCFSCHGPDANARKANLRLDLEEFAKKQKLESGGRAIIPGKAMKSKAFTRILSEDPDIQMPPPESNMSLSQLEIATIEKWIKQGAQYEEHWSFQALKEVEIPKIEASNWVANTIDNFVLSKLNQKDISPNPKAAKEVILRRLSLDLRGLPPSIEEINEFLDDDSPNAYEKLVDQLIASQHYGERMATEWLDVARYSDSHGYSTDGSRTMWPWRDWVINAFNENLPYDDFIKLQVAGDKYPNAKREEIIATAFLRNQKLNAEGGIVLDEYLMEYAADRTETVSTAFLGLTMQCAKCHDHKYDPISQKEYYELFSFFNSVNERGMTPNDGNSGPQLLLSNQEEEEIISFINSKVDSLEEQKRIIAENFNLPSVEDAEIDLANDLILALSFENKNNDFFLDDYKQSKKYKIRGDYNSVDGHSGKGFAFSAFDFVDARNAKLNFDSYDPFTFSFWLKVEGKQEDTPLITHIGGKNDNYTGYEIALFNGYPSLRLIHSLPANMISVQTADEVIEGDWEHYTFTYSGSGSASGVQIFKNGEKIEQETVLDNLSKSIKRRNENIAIGGSRQYQVNVKGRGVFDDIKVYEKALTSIEVSQLFRSGKFSNKDFTRSELTEHFLENEVDEYRQVKNELREQRNQKKKILDTLATVMVMADLDKPRPTFVLDRGAYDQPLERVFPSTPSKILDFDDALPKDRLGLANWLVDPQNPLTARVAVNRIWKLFFNEGIVKTSEDFGSQGGLPKNQELLDYLALEFIKSNWDVKALVKLIVMSSTYRQSSRVSEEKRKYDPQNQLLARGPSQRLQAEFIRDLVLSASALLHTEIGGPSVKPYQPEGLWEEITGNSKTLDRYRQDKGNALYRRSLYTFWRRAAPPPSMTIFDAPSREFCVVSRSQTNTPLQALTLLNDPQFVEAARVLAERVMVAKSALEDQISLAYQLLSGLRPSKDLQVKLGQLYKEQEKYYIENPQLTYKLMKIGSYPANPNLEASKVAALTIVCNTMISFDETIMKR